MSQYNENGYGTVRLSATVEKNQRVTVAGAVAGLTDQAMGTVTARGVSGDVVGVRLANAQGSSKMIAAGAVSAGAKVYGAADGEISATQGTGSFLAGLALEAAAADQDVIEVMNLVGDTAGA